MSEKEKIEELPNILIDNRIPDTEEIINKINEIIRKVNKLWVMK